MGAMSLSEDLAPFRRVTAGSVALSLAITLFLATCLTALGFEAAAIGAGPRLRSDLPTLGVHVHGRGFTLLGADEALGGSAFAVLPCLGETCGARGDYDYDGLTARLARVKDRWPRQDTLLLVPSADVRYEVILDTVAASTVDRRLERRGQGPRLLFPDVRVLAPR